MVYLSILSDSLLLFLKFSHIQSRLDANKPRLKKVILNFRMMRSCLWICFLEEEIFRLLDLCMSENYHEFSWKLKCVEYMHLITLLEKIKTKKLQKLHNCDFGENNGARQN